MATQARASLITSRIAATCTARKTPRPSCVKPRAAPTGQPITSPKSIRENAVARSDPETYRLDDPEWQRIKSLRGKDRLDAYVKQRSRVRWVRASGRPCFVGRRPEGGGTMECFVDQAVAS